MDTEDIVFCVFRFLTSRKILEILFTTRTFHEAGRIVLEKRLERNKLMVRLKKYHKFERTNQEFGLCEFTTLFLNFENERIFKKKENLPVEVKQSQEEYWKKGGVVEFGVFELHPVFKNLKKLPYNVHKMCLVGYFFGLEEEDVRKLEKNYFFTRRRIKKRPLECKNGGDSLYFHRLPPEKYFVSEEDENEGEEEEGDDDEKLPGLANHVLDDPEKNGIYYLCRNPPYGMRGDVSKEIKVLRSFLFGGCEYEEIEEIYDWNVLVEEENDDVIWHERLNYGLEWWGTYCYTYWNRKKNSVVITFASETD